MACHGIQPNPLRATSAVRERDGITCLPFLAASFGSLARLSMRQSKAIWKNANCSKSIHPFASCFSSASLTAARLFANASSYENASLVFHCRIHSFLWIRSLCCRQEAHGRLLANRRGERVAHGGDRIDSR